MTQESVMAEDKDPFTPHGQYLVTQGTKSSAAMVLTYFSQNNSTTALERLKLACFLWVPHDTKGQLI